QPHLTRELEVADFAAFPDQERVRRDCMAHRRADDASVLHAPHGRVAAPTLQRLAVEELLRGLWILGCERGRDTNGRCHGKHAPQCHRSAAFRHVITFANGSTADAMWY